MLSNVKITRCLAYASAATDRNGKAIDMSGFEGALFIFNFAAIATGATMAVHLEQDDVEAMSSAAQIVGTKQVVGASDDDEVFVIDIKMPQKRWLRPVVNKDGSNASAEIVTCIQYGPGSRPTTQGSYVNYEDEHYFPAAGTP